MPRGMLRDLQLAKHGKSCALSLPVVTRWGSHYQATKQLLISQDVIQLLVLDKRADLMGSVGKTRAAKDKAARMLDMAMDSTFWSNLKMVQQHLGPLLVSTSRASQCL